MALRRELQGDDVFVNASRAGGEIGGGGGFDIPPVDDHVVLMVHELDHGGGAQHLDRLLRVRNVGDLHGDAPSAVEVDAGFGVAQGVQTLPEHGLNGVHGFGQVFVGHAVGHQSFIGDLRAAHQVQTQGDAVLHGIDVQGAQIEAEKYGEGQNGDDQNDGGDSQNTLFH